MRTRSFVSLALLFLLSIVSVSTIRPQGNDESQKSKSKAADVQRAGKEKNKNDWSQREPRDGEEWFNRAYELHNSDRYPEAIEAFKRAIELGYRKATAMYNIACGYSLLNDKDNALVWLQRALDNGFDGSERLAEDSDLDPLRTDQRFKDILATTTSDDGRDRIRIEKTSAKSDRLERANLEYARLEREVSRDGDEWARVGLKLLLLRDLDRSIIALNRAVEHLDYKGSTAMYNLACAYALKGDRDSGLEWLEKAVNLGFDSPEKLRNDPDIKSLRTGPRFLRIDKLSKTLSLSQFYTKTDSSSEPDDHGYSTQRWAPAIELYESFVKSEPTNGRGWFNLGYALHYSHEHARAIEAFEQALKFGYHKPVSSYDIACAYAMLNQRDAAFEWLDRAIAAGFDSYGDLSWDRDLDSLRSDPRFKRFIESASASKKMTKKE